MNTSTIKKTALIILATGCLTFVKAQKIAHISLDSLVSVMPETNIAKDVAQNYLKSLDGEMLAMQTEFESKYKDYMEKEASMSEPVKQNKQMDLQQLQKRIEDFRMQAQQDYQKKYGELTAPIMEKAKKGIEAVAKESGYKYVLDTSTGSVLYSEASDDIFTAVKKKLDSMPMANIPGATTGGVKDPKPPVKNTTPAKGGK
jgi:outer membrane protein